MRGSWVTRAGLTASLAAFAAFLPFGGGHASASSLSEGGRVSSSSPALVSSVSTLPGVLAYVSDSDYYGSSGKEMLATVLPDGTHRRTLLAPADVGFGLLEFSPTGRQLAYFHDSSSGARVEVMDVATKKVVRLFALRGTGAYLDGLAWTSSGRDLIVGSNERPGSTKVHSETALWRVPAAGGKPTQLTSFEDSGNPVVLPDGDLVYVVSKTFSSNSLDKSAVWMSGPDGSHPDRLFASGDFLDTPAVSPDGRTLAFSVILSDTTTHLISVTIATRQRKNLTPLVKGRTDISPSWSPSGSEIVFLSSRAGRYSTTTSHQLLDAYVMTATGRNPRKTIFRRGDEWSMVLVAWGA